MLRPTSPLWGGQNLGEVLGGGHFATVAAIARWKSRLQLPIRMREAPNKKTAPKIRSGFKSVLKGQIIFAGLAATYSPTP